MAAAQKPAAALPDEFVEEILLRMPPDEPVLLIPRAPRDAPPPCWVPSATSPPPTTASIARFVPVVRSSLTPRERRGWRAIDSRHGRVLLQRRPSSFLSLTAFSVWDPLRDQLRELPPLPRSGLSSSWNAMVVRATAGYDCDHLDCPFLVVFLGSDHCAGKFFAYLYSSITDAWSEPTTYAPFYWYLWALGRVPHLSNALYFLVTNPILILRYDLVTRQLTVIDPPRVQHGFISLSTMEDGALGCVAAGFRLYLWLREGEMGWVKTRVIKVNTLVPACQFPASIGLCDGGDFYIEDSRWMVGLSALI
ncbi:hypothetical protein EJB05_14807, partial [Eragrostis curvula]